MLSFIQICVCQKSIWTITSKENFPSVSFRVRVRVRIGVSFGDRDNFPRRQLSQNRQKNYDLYLLRLDETMKLIISLLEYSPGATTVRKFPHNKMFQYTEAALKSLACKETIKIAENPQESIFYKNRFNDRQVTAAVRSPDLCVGYLDYA